MMQPDNRASRRAGGYRLLVLIAALAANACTLTPARDATATAQRYANALNAHDYETMIALTDPEVLTRSENGAELRRLFPQVFGAPGVRVDETVREISPGFSDATGMHYFASTTRNSRDPKGRETVMDSYYIVTSRDLGRTWTIVDIACVDERWIKGIAPGWNGYPNAPAQALGRGKVDTRMLDDAPVSREPVSSQ